MEEIFREETKEEVLEEFRERIINEDNYVPIYFDYSIIEARHKDLIRLTKKLGYNVECIFTKDFKNNEDELKEQIKSWFKQNKIKLYTTNELSEEQKLDKEVNHILKVFRQTSGSGLNIMREDVDGNLVELILYGFANTKFNTYTAIFHELGHTLEAKYLNPREKPNKDTSPIREFLYRYQEETTANLFAYSILYLMLSQKTTDKNVLENAKNCIIKSAVLGGSCSEGYFSVPVVIENIDKIKLEEYINEENKIDFEKLYDFCFTAVQIKAKQYEKILISANADKEYINSHFSYKILKKLEIKKDKNELEKDLYIQYSVYKKMVDEKSPLVLKDALKFVLDYCIKVDELKGLERIMKYLKGDELDYTRIERSLTELFNEKLNHK